MGKTGSDDCKAFLVEHFKSKGIDTIEKEWKRVSKRKQGQDVLREFDHPSVGRVEVTETASGEFAIGTSYPKSASDGDREAERLLRFWIEKIGYSDEDELRDSFMERPDFIKNSIFLPKLFRICFEADIYGNPSSVPKSKLDEPIGDMNFHFTDIIEEDPENETCSMLEGLLPEWVDGRCDETEYTLTEEGQKKTVREVVSTLLALGFIVDDDCLFKKHHANGEFAASMKGKDGPDRKLPELLAEVNEVIRNDAKELFAGMLVSGAITPLIVMPNTKTIADAVITKSAFGCVRELLESGFDFWSKSDSLGTHFGLLLGQDAPSELLFDILRNSRTVPTHSVAIDIIHHRDDKTGDLLLLEMEKLGYHHQVLAAFAFSGIDGKRKGLFMDMLARHPESISLRDHLSPPPGFLTEGPHSLLYPFLDGHDFDTSTAIMNTLSISPDDVAWEGKPLRQHLMDEARDLQSKLQNFGNRGIIVEYSDRHGNRWTDADKWMAELNKILNFARQQWKDGGVHAPKP